MPTASFRTVAAAAVLLLPLAIAGCKNSNDLASALRVTRSSCPATAIPTYTNEVTLFDPPASRDAAAIDVVATIDDLKTSCTQGTQAIDAAADFEVAARRTRAQGARDVVLPYYAVVMRGGRTLVSKSLSRVQIHFADGQYRATARGQASTRVDRAAASLPDDVVKQINRKRKAGDADAAIDPMSDPKVRTSVQRASFELLVGFQLTDDQLRYNATR